MNSSKISKNPQLKEFHSILNIQGLVIYCDASDTVKLFRNYGVYKAYIKKNKFENSLSSKSSEVGNGVSVIYDKFGYKGNYRHLRESLAPANGWEHINTYSFPGGGTWDNKAASIRVNNGRIEFYADATSGNPVFLPNSILVMHDTNPDPGQAIGIKNLWQRGRLNTIPYYFNTNWYRVISEARWK